MLKHTGTSRNRHSALECFQSRVRGSNGTVLHVAAACGHEALVRVLLDAGADPSYAVPDYVGEERSRGKTKPEVWARSRGHHAIAQLLQAKGAVTRPVRLQIGQPGVHGFLETTDGFERSVHTDRHDPIYPRSVQLTDSERMFFDTLLDDHRRGLG